MFFKGGRELFYEGVFMEEVVVHIDLKIPDLSLNSIERSAVMKALEMTNGNKAESAKLLGVARSTLFVMLKRHEIVSEMRHVCR